jgi:AmpE protein
MITLISILAVWALFKYAHLRGFFSRIRGIDYLMQKINLSPSVLVLIALIFFAILLHGLRTYFYPIYCLAGIFILAYGWAYEEKNLIIPGTLSDQVRSVFLNALYEPFAVIFWFVILGPLGVLLYDFSRRANLNRYFLDWPAARVLGLGFALAGYFPPAFRYWMSAQKSDSSLFLEEMGMLALTGEQNSPAELQHAQALVKRAEMMLLVAVALVALGRFL